MARTAGLAGWRRLRPQAAERRRAERALRQTEVFYHSLVETLPQMILCKDLEGRFTFANGQFCAELGTTLEEIKGKTDFDFFPRELAEKYRRRRPQGPREPARCSTSSSEHVTPKGEKLYVQAMKTPLFGADGEPIGIQGIFWDVTERMRAEEQLKEQNVTLQELARSEHQAHEALKSAQSRMVETEKLASLGQLVAGVAHEINNPLAFVSNNVAVLERDLRDIIALVGLYRQAREAAGGDRGRRRSKPRRSPSSASSSTSTTAWRTCRGSSIAPARACGGSSGSSRTCGSSPGSTRASGTRSTSTPASSRRSTWSRDTPASTGSSW